MDDPRAGARAPRAPTSSGASPPRSSPAAARARPSAARVALEQLGVLAEVLAHEPREVLDRRAPRRRSCGSGCAGRGPRARDATASRRACHRPAPDRRHPDPAPGAPPTSRSRSPRSRRRPRGARRRGARRRRRRPTRPTRAAAERHGARYVAHAAPRGLNAARNTGVRAHATRELLVFVDDDVAVRRRLARGAARAPPPRSPPTSTSSPARSSPASRTTRCRTLRARGPADHAPRPRPRATRDATHAWGANMAIRRSALERVGPFDESLRARRRRAGVAGAAAAPPAAAHPLRRRRRARAPPRRRRRAPALARARGLPPRPRQPPLRRRQGHGAVARAASCACSPAASLHGPRVAARTGRSLAAHARRRRALPRARCAPDARRPATAGRRRLPLGRERHGRRAPRRAAARWRDVALDARGAARAARCACARRAPRAPRRRVLVLGIERPSAEPDGRGRAPSCCAPATTSSSTSRPPRRPAASSRTSTRCSPRHDLARARLAARPRRRRRAAARLPRPLPVPARALLACASPSPRTGCHSHAAWPVTRRRAGQRRARDELRRDRAGDRVRTRPTFATLLPFPALRMGWGLDVALGRARRASTAGAAAWSTRRRSATVAPRRPTPTRARRRSPRRARFLADRPYVRARRGRSGRSRSAPALVTR